MAQDSFAELRGYFLTSGKRSVSASRSFSAHTHVGLLRKRHCWGWTPAGVLAICSGGTNAACPFSMLSPKIHL